jgi:hypothetical protein
LNDAELPPALHLCTAAQYIPMLQGAHDIMHASV